MRRREFLSLAATAGISAEARPLPLLLRPRISDHRHSVVYRNEHGYAAWPTILQAANGDLLVVFNEAMRRPTKMHADPTYLAMLIRSTDGGKTWSKPSPIGGYTNTGVESIGAVVLRNGDILAQCYLPRYWTEAEGRKRFPAKVPGVTHWKSYGWFQEQGNYNHIYRSTDNGFTWEPPVSFDASPFRMAFMVRGAVELPDGMLVLPCTDDSFDSGRDFVIFSKDGGRTWAKPTAITRDPKLFFSEPALVVTRSGKLVAMLRTHKNGEYFYLHQSESQDGGHSWSESRQTPMWGLPPHLLLLSNGSILCVYGHRRRPFGIRACLSHDEGTTWDIENELILRDDFPNGNLGYPTSLQLSDGRVFTVYYGETDSADPNVQAAGVTQLEASVYRISDMPR